MTHQQENKTRTLSAFYMLQPSLL